MSIINIINFQLSSIMSLSISRTNFWNDRSRSFVRMRVVSSYVYLYIYLPGFGFATFVMRDIVSNKTRSIVQVTQKPLSFLIYSMIRFVFRNRFSKATNRMGFLVTFSQKYVLQMYENEMKVTSLLSRKGINLVGHFATCFT